VEKIIGKTDSSHYDKNVYFSRTCEIWRWFCQGNCSECTSISRDNSVAYWFILIAYLPFRKAKTTTIIIEISEITYYML
jgi:hypothetical protein